MRFLCFDLSSNGISAAILDSRLNATRLEESRWSLETNEHGVATVSVPVIIEQFKSAVSRLKPAGSDHIDAICIDSFMHNFVLLDASDQPLTPVFTWLDRRGSEGIELVRKQMGDRFHQSTGCRFHPMFPVFKLGSMRLAESPALSAAKRIVSIKSLLINKLTDIRIEDHGTASSSGLFNIRDRTWDTEILNLIGLSSACLPEVVSRNKIAGRVTRAAAREFGLAEDTPVVNGTGDGFAANVGSDCETASRISVTLGTSAVVRQTLSKPVLASGAGTFCYMGENEVYLLGCAGSNGGNVLDWGRRIFGSPADANTDADLPVFIPLLHGERSPEWDPDLTGSWYGLKARHTAAHLSRSIVEGVVFNLAHFLEIVQTTSDEKASDLVLSGNGFLEPLAAPILAALAGISVWMPEEPGLMTLRGTAICALRALAERVPELRIRRILAIDDGKILDRYVAYRRFRGNLARV
jgi:gluconokinase